MGKWRTSYKYTYLGKRDKLDAIRVDATLDAKAAGQTPAFKIKAGQVKAQGTGIILFDAGRGRVSASSATISSARARIGSAGQWSRARRMRCCSR